MSQRDLAVRHLALNNLIKKRRGLIALFREDLKDDELSPLRVYRQYINIFYMNLEIFSAEFSVNKPIWELKHQFQNQCLPSYLDLSTEVVEGELPFLPGGYFNLITFLSIAILLVLDKETWQIIAVKWQSFNIQDHFIEVLLKSKIDNYQVGEVYLSKRNKYYQPILKLMNTEPQKFSEALVDYCKKWYGRQKSKTWYASHDNPALECYCGYWAFEAAAIAKIKGINLEGTHLGQYFPYSFFGLPEQLPKVPKSRIEKGFRRINYPEFTRFSIDVPDNYKDRSKERLNVISPSGTLEIACTLYIAKRQSLGQFHADRSEGIVQNMPWYKSQGRAIPSKVGKFDAMREDFVGLWPNENKPTYYRVFSFGFKGYFVGLTYTCLEAHAQIFDETINKITKFVKISPG